MIPRTSIRAMWLLALFLLAQAVPVVALAATDGMTGMACCRHGRDSCCRRKPMPGGVSLRTGHPCGMPCAGTPTVSMHGGAAALAPRVQTVWARTEALPVGRVGLASRPEAGYDRARFQRPPPVFV